MPVVLLKPPDPVIAQPSRQEKRLADGRREPLDQHPGDVRGDEQVGIPVIGPHTGQECSRIEPGRGHGDPLEEVSQDLGRFPQDVLLPFHAGLDEPMHLRLVERGQRFDHGVRGRVTDAGVRDVVGRAVRTLGPGPFVPVSIDGGDAVAPVAHADAHENVTASGRRCDNRPIIGEGLAAGSDPGGRERIDSFPYRILAASLRGNPLDP